MSAIDARDVIARIKAVVDNVVLAISIVGGIALASGVLILVGAVAMTKFQRVYEAAILRTLGASTRLLTTMVALEYSALGLLAGLIGALGALGLSWAVTQIPARHRVEAGAPAARRRRASDDGARRHRWRARERRSPAPEAARGAARGVRALARARQARSGGGQKSAKIEFCRERQKGACGEEAWSSRIRMRFSGNAARSWRMGGGVKPLTTSAETNSRQGDLADQASGNNEVHIQLKLKQTDAKILQAIEEALYRMEKGTFGVCRDCGEPIAPARLNAIPWTRVCITCKEKQST